MGRLSDRRARASGPSTSTGRRYARGRASGCRLTWRSNASNPFGIGGVPTDGTRPATAPAARAVVAADADALDRQPWFNAFEAAYKLAEGEVLRHVPRPFVDERDRFYDWWRRAPRQPGEPAPSWMLLHGDLGRDRGPGVQVAFTGPNGVKAPDLIARFARLRPHEYVLPADLPLAPLPEGDWVMDVTVPVERRMAAIAEMLLTDDERAVEFVAERHEADAVLVTTPRGADGKPMPVPQDDREPIELNLSQSPHIGDEQVAGTLSNVLIAISRASNWPVLDERELLHQRLDARGITFRHARSGPAEQPGEPAPRADVVALMDALKARAGFEYRIERRAYTRWALMPR